MAPFLAEAAAIADGGDRSALIAFAEARLAARPGDAGALVALAYAALASDQIVLALDALREALATAPGSALIADMLASLFALAGELPEATYYAKLAVANGLNEQTLALRPALWPDFAAAFAAVREHPFLTRGLEALAAGDLTGALRLLEAQAAFSPNHGETQRALADTLIADGQPRAAADILARFAANDAADGCDMARLARCLADCGEWDAARGVIGSASPHADEDSVAEITAAALHVALLSPTTKTLPASLAAEAPLVEPDPAPLPERPRIGVLATALGGPGDIESLAALAQGLRETGASLVVFGAGPLTAPHNRLLQGRVGRHIDAAEFDAFTLAHTVMAEGVDLLLDAGGIAAPLHLATLAQHPAPRVAGWLNLPVDTGIAGLDRVLGAAPPSGGIIGRLDAAPRLEPADDVPLIGADIAAGQMHDDMLHAFAAILHAVPHARLLLRDRELSHPDMVGTLIERFGALAIADRIEIVDTDHVTFVAGLDLLLHPFAAESGDDVVDASAHGTPAVALRGSVPWRRQGADALQSLGLGARVATTEDAYAAIGAGLLTDRARARSETAAVIATAPAFAPAAFATGLLELFRS